MKAGFLNKPRPAARRSADEAQVKKPSSASKAKAATKAKNVQSAVSDADIRSDIPALPWSSMPGVPPQTLVPPREVLHALRQTGAIRFVPQILTADGLEACACDNASVESRQDLMQTLRKEASTFIPPANQTLVISEMDAGRLYQTAEYLNMFSELGRKNFTLNITDPHYPIELCGEYKLQAGQWDRRVISQAADCPFPDSAASRALDAKAAAALARFLENTGLWCLRLNVEMVVNVYRRVETLNLRVANGFVPRSHLILGVDLETPSWARPTEANCLVIKDNFGTIGAWRLPDGRVQHFKMSGRIDSPSATVAETRLGALVARWSDSPQQFVEAITQHNPGEVFWFDNSMLRFGGLCHGAAEPRAQSYLLFGSSVTSSPASALAGFGYATETADVLRRVMEELAA